MSWRDSLRPGSFRGVQFLTVDHSKDGGRRGVVHEFPGRDEPYFEDLGRKARAWSIEALVLGSDYMVARDALEAACEAQGAGTLVHHYLGTFQAVCTSFTISESTSEGGMARFSMEFVEPGVAVPAGGRADTAAIAAGVADRRLAQAPQVFANRFSTADAPSFVEDAAASLLQRQVSVVGFSALSLGGAGSALRAWEIGIGVISGAPRALVRQPLALGQAVVSMIGALAGLATSNSGRIGAMRAIMSDVLAWPAVIDSTVARRRQRANQLAFASLIIGCAAAELVRAAANSTFTSYDEAVATRNSLFDDIDLAAMRAADAGDDEQADALDALARAMVKDITARGGTLARLYGYHTRVTEPALVIAQRLHGDTGLVVDRAAELVARNAVRHPGFVPGGRTLEVASDA